MIKIFVSDLCISYRVSYRIEEHTVTVAAVIHGKRTLASVHHDDEQIDAG